MKKYLLAIQTERWLSDTAHLSKLKLRILRSDPHRLIDSY